MYNSNTDSLGLILGVEVFFLLVTVQEHCECNAMAGMLHVLGYTYVQIFLATDFHIYFKCYNSGGDEVEEEKRLSWKNVIIWTGGDGPCRVFDIYNYIDISKLWLNMNF